MLLAGRQEGHPACKKYGEDGGGGHCLDQMERHPAGWSVCLPLLIFPCTIKSRSSRLAPAHPGGPGKRAVKRSWCGVVVCYGNVKFDQNLIYRPLACSYMNTTVVKIMMPVIHNQPLYGHYTSQPAAPAIKCRIFVEAWFYYHDDQGDNPGQATEGSTVSSIKCDRCWHLD